jgi:hypothetical protein
MLNRSALLVVAGAAIFALDASAASAQDTSRARPRSQKPIPIKKDAGGEVTIPVRVDSVTIYRTDTLRLPGRVDTVTTTLTNTVLRIDTVSIPLPAVLQKFGGVYFGLAGGSSLPGSDFNDSDHPGWRVDGMLGVDPIGSPLGLRLTAGYSRYQPHSYVSQFLSNAQIMSATLDGKLRVLAISPFSKRVQIYGIAGGTYNRFKDILENNRGQFSIGDAVFPNNVISNPDHGWHNGLGWNAGGGAEMGWGRTNLFIESRFSSFKGEHGNIAFVPIVLGVSWF